MWPVEVVGDISLRVIIGSADTTNAKKGLADVVEHDGTLYCLGEVIAIFGVACFVAVGHPDEKRHFKLVFKGLWGDVAMFPSCEVTVVVDFLSMVGEIHDDRILVFIEVDDFSYYIVIIVSGIVVAGNLVFDLFSHETVIAPNAVSPEADEHSRAWVSMGCGEMLSHEVQDVKSVQCVMVGFFLKCLHQLQVVFVGALVGLVVTGLADIVVVEK